MTGYWGGEEVVVTNAWQGGDHWGNHEEKFITIIKLSRESRDLCYAAIMLLLHGIMGRRFPDGGLLRYRK